MATKDITDKDVVTAYYRAAQYREKHPGEKAVTAMDYLQQKTGQDRKVCLSAAKRAHERGYIEYGVSLQSGWTTPEGDELRKTPNPRITAKQEGGDDGYCYVLRINGHEVMSGISRREVPYYKNHALHLFFANPERYPKQ